MRILRREKKEKPAAGAGTAEPPPPEMDAPSPPRKSRAKFPELGAAGTIIALVFSVLIGLAVVIFGGKSETDLRPFGPIIPCIVGAVCSMSGTIAYGIVGIAAMAALWAVILFR